MSDSQREVSTLSSGRKERSFMFVKYVSHEGLVSIQYKTFFHMCRLESISFDLEGKTGSTFVLSDCLQSGVLSLITIGEQRKDALAAMNNALLFIKQHVYIYIYILYIYNIGRRAPKQTFATR